MEENQPWDGEKGYHAKAATVAKEHQIADGKKREAAKPQRSRARTDSNAFPGSFRETWEQMEQWSLQEIIEA